MGMTKKMDKVRPLVKGEKIEFDLSETEMTEDKFRKEGEDAAKE